MNPLMNAMRGGMKDPFGSMNGFLGQFQGMMRNPMQYMMQRRLNLPQDWMQNPRGAVQQLMNSGAMSQEQFNALQQMAGQIQNTPQWKQMTGPKNAGQRGE